jgi:hypothetical protein
MELELDWQRPNRPTAINRIHVQTAFPFNNIRQVSLAEMKMLLTKKQ